MNENSKDSKALKAEDIVTEDQLLNWLDLKKTTLNGLRLNRGFPFIRVTQSDRVYYLPDVLAWLLENRRPLNRGQDSLAAMPQNDS